MTDAGIKSPDELGVVVSINYVLYCFSAWPGFYTAYLVITKYLFSHIKNGNCKFFKTH